MASIDQIYPREIRREVEESIADGPLVVAANPGAGATELVRAIVLDTIVIRAQTAATPLGFRIQFARALVAWAAARLPRGDAGTSLQSPVIAMLATPFGRRAGDIVALANGDAQRDVRFADLTRGLPAQTVVVVDAAHLVDSVAGPETLWALRDHRHVVLVTRPWFVESLRHPDAAFFGHGRTLDLSAVTFRPPVHDRTDAAFLVERTLGNAELVVEVLERGEGDVRRGWAEAVEARRTVTTAFLDAGFAIHQFGPGLLNAIAAEEAPYAAIPGGSTARIANALRALRDHDFIYPPRPRRWRLADPAMAAALRGAVS